MKQESNVNNNEFIVKIEGGLGAQIIGLSTYYFLKSIGCKVLADVSYFDYPLRIAEIGKPEVTHWDWQLNYYNIDLDSFDWINTNKLRQFFVNSLVDNKEGIEIFDFKKTLEKYKQNTNKRFEDYNFISKRQSDFSNFFEKNPVLIKDGPNKAKLFINAMKNKNIKNNFLGISNKWKRIIKKKNIDLDKSCCVHIRRGDYLNVANHLMSEESIFEISNKLPKFIKDIVIFSDSDSGDNEIFIKKLKNKFENVFWMDNLHFIDAHQIMRESQILICSNSQFSLTAAYLGENFSIIPQKFSADDDFIFQYRNQQTSFALLNN